MENNNNNSSYESMEVERYHSFLGIISYVIGFFLVGSILTLISAKYIASANDINYKDLIEAATTIPADSKLRECAAKLTCYSNLLIYFVVLCAIVATMLISIKKDALDFKNRYKRLTVIALASAVSFFLISFLLDIISSKIASGSSTNQELIEEVFNHKSLAALMLIETVIFAPFVEEMVFRKAIFNVFKNKPLWIPILISSFAFSIIHMAATDFGWKWVVLYIPYLTCGFMFAGIYKLSGENIYVTMFVHMINNLMACLLIIL